MDTIKLHKFDISDGFYFLDAGDITIEPVAEWYSIIIKKKGGLPLFKMEMNPDYVYAFGFIIGDILDRKYFDFPAGMKPENVLEVKTVACFDPRVVSFIIFMGALRSNLPILSFEEAKDFLKKNNLFWENPNSEWRPNPPKELIDIPEKIKRLF